MKKIIYIANARIPTEKAHGFNMNTMCERFAEEGHQVTMLAPTRRNKIKESPYEYYKLKSNYEIVYLKSPDFVDFLGPVGFLATTWIFSFIAVREALRRGFDFVYSRDGRAMWLLSWYNRDFGWEIHDDQRKWWAKRVLRTARGIVTTNRALIPLHEKFAGRALKAIAVPNGVSLNEFMREKSREDIRAELGLPLGKKTVLYTGHLYAYKGVDTLAEAARLLPECDFLFVGGTEEDIKRFSEKYKDVPNVKLLGHKPHKWVFMYMRAADVVTLPNSARDEFSSLYTSPIKLFEYLGSGTPIVAADLPSIREIVDESDTYLFTPDDAKDLARAIAAVFERPAEAARKAKAALEKAETYTWSNRAQRILRFYGL